MSLATTLPFDDSFDDFEFAVIVADFHTQPMGEPPLDQEPVRVPRQRGARAVEKRQAIAASQGIRRHRTHEREV